MSDYYIKMIPKQPEYRASEPVLDSARAFLEAVGNAERVNAAVHDAPVFIDCGGNLEEIVCPVCGQTLDLAWWGEAMSAAAEQGFADLTVKLPCCGGDSSLNDLEYYFPCGFAATELTLVNPAIELGEDVIARLGEILETPVRVVRAHL